MLKCLFIFQRGAYSQKEWAGGCAAHFPKPLPYLLSKSVIFPILFYDLTNNNPIFDLNLKSNPVSSSDQS